MDNDDLQRLTKLAQDRYDAMPASARLRHDYRQRKSFARGYHDGTDYGARCKFLDKTMPDPCGLTDAQIGLILIGRPWHL